VSDSQVNELAERIRREGRAWRWRSGADEYAADRELLWAVDLLEQSGVIAEPDHDPECLFHPDNREEFARMRSRLRSYETIPARCTRSCRPVWPDWVTSEVFEAVARPVLALRTFQELVTHIKPPERRSERAR
jgi:hypothetical protein